MKKMILGATMMFTGMISSAILIAGAMIQNQTEALSFYSIMITYEIMPIFIVFIAIAFLGFIISLQSVLGNKENLKIVGDKNNGKAATTKR